MASNNPSPTAVAASTATPMAMSSSSDAGIIAGGVIGGVLLFAIAAFALYKYERRARRRRASFNASSDTLVEKSVEKGEEQAFSSKNSTIPHLDPIPQMTMTPQPVQMENYARTSPTLELPTSILRRPDPAAIPERANPRALAMQRVPMLRFRDDTLRPPPPGPLRLVGSPATDSSASPGPWKSALEEGVPLRRISISTSDISAPLHRGLPPRPSFDLSRVQPSSRSDVLPPRSAPPSSFGFAKDPFRTPPSSDDGHGRRSLDLAPERVAPSPSAPTPILLRTVRVSTDQVPMSRAVSPAPTPRTVSQMPISRNVSVRRAPSATARPGLPTSPRPTIVIPPSGNVGLMRSPSVGPTTQVGQLRSLETPVYPSQYSPVETGELNDPRYYPVGPTLSRAVSARELRRASTAHAAPKLWRYPTTRAPRTNVDIV